jgi:hypothetical protein
MNEDEILERGRLVSLAQAVLNGRLSFFEGAAQVLAIKSRLGEVVDRGTDFDVFVAIQSETDHLPLQVYRPLWAPAALAELESEFNRTEEWAKSFAPQACRNLIARFSADQPQPS